MPIRSVSQKRTVRDIREVRWGGSRVVGGVIVVRTSPRAGGGGSRAGMPEANLTTLLSTEEIAKRVRELGAEITRDYEGRRLVLVCVLKGSFVFTADLARAIDLPLALEFLGLKSYGDAQTTSGVVQITSDLGRPVAGKDLLIVEDIVDT